MIASRAATTRPTVAEGFAQLSWAIVQRLPFGLARWVAPTFLGFAVINGFTFAVDLITLTLLHGWWGWPVSAAITVAYLGAFGLSFALNRRLNFRSHAPLGYQTRRYAAVIAVNYVVVLLGIGGGLTAIGVPYQLARLLAGAGEGVFMYCALRWVVFRSRPSEPSTHSGSVRD